MRISLRLNPESLRIMVNHWESISDIFENHQESWRITENCQESMRISFKLIQESSRITDNHQESISDIFENHLESPRINFWPI